MTVRVTHRRSGPISVAVITGLDQEAAVVRLARSLESGTAFPAARALLVDVSGVPQLSDTSVQLLRDAARSVAGQRRLLRLVDRQQRIYTDEPPETSVSAALSYVAWFFRMVDGHSRRSRLLADVLRFVLAGTQTAVQVGASIASVALRRLT